MDEDNKITDETPKKQVIETEVPLGPVNSAAKGK